MDTWEVYFQTILILIVMYMQVMQAMLILAKALLATYVSWSQEIQFLAKPNTNICCSKTYGGEIHGCKCRGTRSQVTRSITRANGYAYRSSIIMITDPPGDRHTLNIVILARNLLVKHRLFFWYYRTSVCSYRRTTCRRNDESSTISYLSGYLS